MEKNMETTIMGHTPPPPLKWRINGKQNGTCNGKLGNCGYIGSKVCRVQGLVAQGLGLKLRFLLLKVGV